LLHVDELRVNPGGRDPDACEDSPMERHQDYVLRSVEERGIRFIRLWFTDVLGQLKSIACSTRSA
jgi:hypothetical protein